MDPQARLKVNDNFIERNNRDIQIRMERLVEYEQLKKMKETEIGFDFKPKINKEKPLERTVDDLFKWKQQLERKKEQQRKTRELEMPKSADKVCAKNVHLDERWVELQRKKSRMTARPITPTKHDGLNVSSRLYDYGKIYEKKRKEREEKLYSGLFYPQTTRYIKRPTDMSADIYPKSTRVVFQRHNKTPVIKHGDRNQLITSKSNNDLTKNDISKHDLTNIDAQMNSEQVSHQALWTRKADDDYVSIEKVNQSSDQGDIIDSSNNPNISDVFDRKIVEYGTQTSDTFFNILGNIQADEDVTNFKQDEKSRKNDILHEVINSYVENIQVSDKN